MVVLIYILTNNSWEKFRLHIFNSICLLLILLIDIKWGEMTSHCVTDLQKCWVFFHEFVNHFNFLFSEVSIHIIFQVFYWLIKIFDKLNNRARVVAQCYRIYLTFLIQKPAAQNQTDNKYIYICNPIILSFQRIVQ
jgi:hypothetical protein